MASLEPPPLDFNDTFVNEEDSNDDLFLPTKSPCLNNLAQVRFINVCWIKLPNRSNFCLYWCLNSTSGDIII